MDHIHATLKKGKMVFHEEVARDGAQGKTLLSGANRVRIARWHSKLMGPKAFESFVFMAGFPSAGREEFEAVRKVVAEVDSCYLGVAGRLIGSDIDALVKSMGGVCFGRIVLILPVSERTSAVLLKRSVNEALELALAKMSEVRARAPHLAVDIAFVDAGRADYAFVSEAAIQLTEAGASTIIICDTVGGLFPTEAENFFRSVQDGVAGRAHFIVHMHNDLGFGLMNTASALRHGIRGLTSSWLGLGERSGMPSTEQLLFVLGYEPDKLAQRLGVSGDLWTCRPNLREIVPLAREIANLVGFELRTTDPIIGSGVNSISTGLPFANPELFSPYSPEDVLGVPRLVLLTALASKPIIREVSDKLGYNLTDDQVTAALDWVKATAHENEQAIVSDRDFDRWLAFFARDETPQLHAL